jgi:hypothetical protein
MPQNPREDPLSLLLIETAGPSGRSKLFPMGSGEVVAVSAMGIIEL